MGFMGKYQDSLEIGIKTMHVHLYC